MGLQIVKFVQTKNLFKSIVFIDETKSLAILMNFEKKKIIFPTPGGRCVIPKFPQIYG